MMSNSVLPKTRGRSRFIARPGTLLLVVLVVIVLLTLSAYTFTTLMQTELEAAQLNSRRIQSKYLVDSGVNYARLMLSYDNPTIKEKGGLWDNEAFSAVPVSVEEDNPNAVGRFTIIAPNLDDNGNSASTRFGLIDESSKLNLNVLPIVDNYPPGEVARELLLALPNMTEEIADAILDFLDEDDEIRELGPGAESDYYSSLNPPYKCKNGPLDSLDELLLVKGVTPELLFGNDLNRNGILEDEERNSETALDDDMQLGWINYLTLYSKESNLNDEGLVRVNINGEDLEQVYEDLGSAFDEQWRLFVIMARVNGIMQASELPEGAEPVANAPFIDLDFDALEPTYAFGQVLDLIGTFTTLQDPASGEEIILQSPLQLLDPTLGLKIIIALDNMTTYEGPAIPGRINIMQAPRRILEGIPFLTLDVVDEIILKRHGDFELLVPEGADLNRKYETWLFTEGLIDLETMRAIMPFVCTGGDVYKAEVVGYFDDEVGTSRAEVYLDTTQPLPRILSWIKKSHLQTGYSIDVLGRDLIEE